MDWKSFSFRSSQVSNDWRAITGRNKIIEGADRVHREACKWQPTTPLLVASPGSLNFYSVIDVSAFSEAAFSSAKNKNAWAAVATLFVSAILFIDGKYGQSLPLAIAWLYLSAQYFFVTRKIEELSKEAKYFSWVFFNFRGYFFAAAGFCLFIGTAQWGLTWLYGGVDSTILHWGMVYRNWNDGEYWRALYGWIFHSGFVHWAINSVLLILSFPLVAATSKRKSILSLISGNIIGCIAAVLVANYFNPSHSSGYVGMSAGVLAVLGCGIGLSTKRHLPLGVFILFIGFSAICVGSGFFLGMSMPSNSAHVAGLTSGFLLGMFPTWRKKSGNRKR